MLVLWGVGDQFNPTNNLNSDDLRDPLLFGKQQPNFMVKADYWITKTFSLSGVLVPPLPPALLPVSATLGAADIQRMPFLDDGIRHRIESEFGYAASNVIGYPTVIRSLTPVLPPASADNMQFAFRLAGTFAEQDIALSYYVGRTDFPQPFSNHTSQVDGVRCDPNNPKNCTTGVLATDTLLTYPRMHVYGLNMTGEIPLNKISESVRGLGYRFELGIIVPQRTTIQLTQDALTAVLQPAGEYDYGSNGKAGGQPPVVIESTPSPSVDARPRLHLRPHVYVNAQWAPRARRRKSGAPATSSTRAASPSAPAASPPASPAVLIANCVVPMDGTRAPRRPSPTASATPGPRRRLLPVPRRRGPLPPVHRLGLDGTFDSYYDTTQNQRVMVKHSMFTSEGFSASIYPELDYNFGNGLELGAGALVLLGASTTKFGDPARGAR